MNRQDKKDFLALLESMTVESAQGAGLGHVGHTDVLVGGQHVARAEYLPRVDQFHIDTCAGGFDL